MSALALIALPVAGTAVAGGAGSAEAVAVPFWLELVAIVVSSISGALTAREKQLDLVGAACLAVACSLGGGLLRDMILQVGDVYIFNQPAALPAAIITALVVFLVPSVLEKQDRLIAVLDIFAVGLYAATGADKALAYGFNPLICVTMGFFTGVGGGMLRDICLGQTPRIFQRSNFYAVAAIAGAAVYVALAGAGISHVAAVVVCVVVTMALRWVSLRFNIMSPTDVDLTKVDLSRVVRKRAPGDAAHVRLERPDRSASELAERRERTLADIERRRRGERLARLFRGPGKR